MPTKRPGNAALAIVAEETAFAGHGDKRDVTKSLMLQLDRPAASGSGA
jgi:hypothetical protein